MNLMRTATMESNQGTLLTIMRELAALNYKVEVLAVLPEKVDGLISRFEALEDRFDKLEAWVADDSSRINVLSNTVLLLSETVVSINNRLAALENQFGNNGHT